MTAFIDVLGFGSQVANACSGYDLQVLLKCISRIRKAFQHKPNYPSATAIHAANRKSVLAFSDSVIVIVHLASRITEIEDTFDALTCELHSMVFAQATCIEHALFMRGGGDFDQWYRDGTKLVSKSLANAYALKSEAFVLVIAVAHRVYDYAQ